MKKLFVLLFIVAAIPLGLHLLDQRFAQRVPASDNQNSSESVTGQDFDLSEASPEEFKKAFKYQVLKDVKIQNSSLGSGLSLGLFLLKNADGSKVFVCDEYPTIDLIFAAEGIAHSGEIPHMVVRGPCLTNADLRHIEALPIPFTEILKGPINQREFTSSVPGSRENVRIYFRNVVDFMPTEWTWVGVTFYGKNPQETLQINGYEVISVLGEPLVLRANTNE